MTSRPSPADSSATSSTQPSCRVDSTPTLRLTPLGAAEIETTLKQRGSRYGSFIDNSDLSQGLKRVMENHPNWGLMPDYQREALQMIQHKISRQICGDHTYDDNLRDIAGYASLALKILTGEDV